MFKVRKVFKKVVKKCEKVSLKNCQDFFKNQIKKIQKIFEKMKIRKNKERTKN